MEQPHTEAAIDHTDGQQNTGNHPKPGLQPGRTVAGGTRAGAENVERDGKSESIESGTDVDRISGLDEPLHSTKPIDHPHERSPERDEHGRM